MFSNSANTVKEAMGVGGLSCRQFTIRFGVLLAGASTTKVLLVLHHMRLSVYSIRTFFRHQKKFLFPSILHHWETYRGVPIRQLKQTSNVVWTGDGRFDSMGHSAKYGVYTMFSSTNMKIVHFELLQVIMSNGYKNSK